MRLTIFIPGFCFLAAGLAATPALPQEVREGDTMSASEIAEFLSHRAARSGVQSRGVQVVPDEPIPQRVLRFRLSFATDSTKPAESSDEAIQRIVEATADPRLRDARFYINGHTDSSGDASYNLELSRQRANAARQRMIDLGLVAPERFEARGFGEQRPIASNSDPDGRRKNRRVEIEIR